MERGGRLADLFARPAGELFPDGLDHLPLARNDLQCVGYILSHLDDAIRPAAIALGGCRDHNALARQVLWKLFAGWFAPGEGCDGGLRVGSDLLNRQRILSCRRFQLLELQLQLVKQSRTAFRRLAVFVTPKFGDLKLQLFDHRFRAAHRRADLQQRAVGRFSTGL